MERGSLELASWGGLTYYMIKEEDNGYLPNSQLRIVKDILGKEYNVKELLDRWDYLNQDCVPERVEKIKFQLN